ncbi:GLPGLI family protein [Chryseobacterium soli]|uniref:GLPGLI family protein n=1 Tax=Chryseobacterium soli TaxID=445961 RepID=UPI002953F20F|nr:GLPGLI family protein [Chryseobacterium soli]MDV7698605.1 GLPGLI family protein [Chryseobacterium soli]
MKIYSVLLLLIISLFNGQTIINSSGFALKPSPYHVVDYELSSYNIYYQLQFSNNPDHPENKREALCVLQFGKNFSKFTDVNQLKKDTLTEKFSHQDMVNAKEAGEMLNIHINYPTIIVKKLADKELIVQDRLRDVYQYEEKQSVFNWKLEKGEKKILGYSCAKAVASYRGRTYTAWFTKEVAINNGPYVFEGLPGLILEVEDAKNDFHFVAVGIDRKPLPIYLRNEDTIFKVSREKFRQVQKTYHDNPGFFYGKAYNEDGSVITTKAKPLPYNPIELE